MQADKILVQELSSTAYQVSLNIPAPEVDKKFNDFLETVKKDAQIPGFRKGKAPIDRLRAVLGDRIKSPVSQILINEYLTKALQEHEIVPISAPTVKDPEPGAKYPGKFGFDNSFTVDVLVEVLPKIDPVGYENMELNLPELNMDELFDRKMKVYREQFAERNQVTERGAELGDTIVIDFFGYLGDEQFEGGSAKGHTLDKLGSGSFIPGFEDQLVGVKSGETKDVVVTFPEEYRAKHLAGQEARFEVTVHNIVETKLAEVDEDLAMMVGYESVEAFETQVRAEAEAEAKAQIRQIADQQVVQKLLELNEFDAPKSMVTKEKQRLRQRFQVETLPDNVLAQLEKQAEIGVKRAIVIDAIYDKEDSIEIAPEELNELLEHHAKANNSTKDEIVSALYNSGQMDNFTGVLRISKVIDFIIDNSKKEESEEAE